ASIVHRTGEVLAEPLEPANLRDQVFCSDILSRIRNIQIPQGILTTADIEAELVDQVDVVEDVCRDVPLHVHVHEIARIIEVEVEQCLRLHENTADGIV